MRVGCLVALCGILLLPGSAAAEMTKSRRVGPWNVGVFSENGQFQHCIMARPERGGTPGFGLATGTTYLTLAMFSEKWKLDPGSTYPVTLVAGGVSEEFEAKVEGATTVGIALGGRQAFVKALFLASSVEVRTPASTLRLPLDRSAAALRTLNECFLAESKAASNPFGAPGAPAAQPGNPFKPADPRAPAKPTPAAPAAPAQPDAAYLKARADCEQDGDADRQIAGCTKVIEAARDTREVLGIALANRAFGYVSKDDAANALASFAGAIEFYPGYANARWGRGDLHFGRGEWDEAIRDFDAALTIDPKDDYSRKRRAEAQAKKVAAAAAQPQKPVAPTTGMAAAFGGMGDAVTGRASAPAVPPSPASPPPAPAVAPAPKEAGGQVATAAPVQASPPSAPAANAPPSADALAQMRREAVTVVEMIGLAPQTCGFSPVLPTIAAIAKISQFSPDMLEAEPYAGQRRADARRLEAEALADKASFCARAWAEYGQAGSLVPQVFTR